MKKTLLIIFVVKLITSSHYLSGDTLAEQRYNEMVKLRLEEINGKSTIELLNISINEHRDYPLREAAIILLGENSGKEVIKTLLDIYKIESNKCLAFPRSIHEFRPSCHLVEKVSQSIVIIETRDISKIEKIHRYIDYIRKQEEGYADGARLLLLKEELTEKDLENIIEKYVGDISDKVRYSMVELLLKYPKASLLPYMIMLSSDNEIG